MGLTAILAWGRRLVNKHVVSSHSWTFAGAQHCLKARAEGEFDNKLRRATTFSLGRTTVHCYETQLHSKSMERMKNVKFCRCLQHNTWYSHSKKPNDSIVRSVFFSQKPFCRKKRCFKTRVFISSPPSPQQAFTIYRQATEVHETQTWISQSVSTRVTTYLVLLAQMLQDPNFFGCLPMEAFLVSNDFQRNMALTLVVVDLQNLCNKYAVHSMIGYKKNDPAGQTARNFKVYEGK